MSTSSFYLSTLAHGGWFWGLRRALGLEDAASMALGQAGGAWGTGGGLCSICALARSPTLPREAWDKT